MRQTKHLLPPPVNDAEPSTHTWEYKFNWYLLGLGLGGLHSLTHSTSPLEP